MQKLLQKHGTGIITLLSAVLLLFLFGCGGEKYESGYGVTTIFIEYFDKDNEGYQLMNDSDKYAVFQDRMPLEILSFTENGTEVLCNSFSERNIVSITLSKFAIQTIGEHHYTLKYKAPSVRGESVEEIKLTFKVNTTDYPFGEFTEAWYNGTSIPIVAPEIYSPMEQNLQNPQYVFNKEEWERGMKEHFYNGNMVAGTTNGFIHIVLPIEKPKP